MSEDVYDVARHENPTRECTNCGAVFPEWVDVSTDEGAYVVDFNECPGCGADLATPQDFTGRL